MGSNKGWILNDQLKAGNIRGTVEDVERTRQDKVRAAVGQPLATYLDQWREYDPQLAAREQERQRPLTYPELANELQGILSGYSTQAKQQYQRDPSDLAAKAALDTALSREGIFWKTLQDSGKGHPSKILGQLKGAGRHALSTASFGLADDALGIPGGVPWPGERVGGTIGGVAGLLGGIAGGLKAATAYGPKVVAGITRNAPKLAQAGTRAMTALEQPGMLQATGRMMVKNAPAGLVSAGQEAGRIRSESLAGAEVDPLGALGSILFSYSTGAGANALGASRAMQRFSRGAERIATNPTTLGTTPEKFARNEKIKNAGVQTGINFFETLGDLWAGRVATPHSWAPFEGGADRSSFLTLGAMLAPGAALQALPTRGRSLAELSGWTPKPASTAAPSPGAPAPAATAGAQAPAPAPRPTVQPPGPATAPPTSRIPREQGKAIYDEPIEHYNAVDVMKQQEEIARQGGIYHKKIKDLRRPHPISRELQAGYIEVNGKLGQLLRKRPGLGKQSQDRSDKIVYDVIFEDGTAGTIPIGQFINSQRSYYVGPTDELWNLLPGYWGLNTPVPLPIRAANQSGSPVLEFQYIYGIDRKNGKVLVSRGIGWDDAPQEFRIDQLPESAKLREQLLTPTQEQLEYDKAIREAQQAHMRQKLAGQGLPKSDIGPAVPESVAEFNAIQQGLAGQMESTVAAKRPVAPAPRTKAKSPGAAPTPSAPKKKKKTPPPEEAQGPTQPIPPDLGAAPKKKKGRGYEPGDPF